VEKRDSSGIGIRIAVMVGGMVTYVVGWAGRGGVERTAARWNHDPRTEASNIAVVLMESDLTIYKDLRFIILILTL
jgi:hypothetical protein